VWVEFERTDVFATASDSAGFAFGFDELFFGLACSAAVAVGVGGDGVAGAAGITGVGVGVASGTSEIGAGDRCAVITSKLTISKERKAKFMGRNYRLLKLSYFPM
jgi:hypothetical protein